MDNGAPKPQQDFPPVATGIYLTIATVAAINIVSFVGFSRPLAMVVLSVTVLLLIGGLLAHLRIQGAWSRRNQEHRDWLAAMGSMDLMDFRLRLLRREVEVEQAKQNWARPLSATVLLAASSLIVPYEMLMSLSPGGGSRVLLGLWVYFSLVMALVYGFLTLRAAVRQQRAELDGGQDHDHGASTSDHQIDA